MRKNWKQFFTIKGSGVIADEFSEARCDIATPDKSN